MYPACICMSHMLFSISEAGMSTDVYPLNDELISLIKRGVLTWRM